MKNGSFYLPAAVYTLAALALSIVLQTSAPLWYAWAALLWVGGFLLHKRKIWGILFGLLPALHLLYMSTQYTGQVINIEMPLGIATALYVLGCGYRVRKQEANKQ